MSARKKIKIGFVGSGHMANIHASALREIEGVEFDSWTASERENAAKSARKFGGKPLPLEALLKAKDIDVIAISTPTHLHHEQIIKAIQSGKHVFCEKPIAREQIQAEAVLKACKETQQKIYIGHILRFYPCYRKARDLLLSGEIGVLRRVVCRRLIPLPPEKSAWLLDYAKSGGCILNLLIDEFDFLNWCLGMPTRVEVEAHPDKDPRGITHARVYLYFENGSKAEVEGGWTDDCHEISLCFEGDDGKIFIDSLEGSVKIEDQSGLTQIDVSSDSPYLLQMEHFIKQLRSDSPFLISLEDACDALSISLSGLKKLEKQIEKSNRSKTFILA